MPDAGREFSDAVWFDFEPALRQSRQSSQRGKLFPASGSSPGHSVLHTTAHEESRSPLLFPTPVPFF
jgi:hypothetical protein